MSTKSESYPNSNQEVTVSEQSGFLIKIISLENITQMNKIKVKIDFNGNNLGCSQPIIVNSETEVVWEFFFEADHTQTVIDDLIAHPLLFSVLCEDTSVSPVILPKKTDKGKYEGALNKISDSKSHSKIETLVKENSLPLSSKTNKKSAVSKKKNMSKKPSLENTSELFVEIGVANLDMLPLLLGKEQIVEVLLIHTTEQRTRRGSKDISSTDPPSVKIMVTGKGNITSLISANINNILYFTLESLHNITPDFSELVQVATVLPHDREFEVVKFKNASLVVDNMTLSSKKKKWFDLSDKQGQGALSTYNITEDDVGLINTMDYLVTKETLKSVPRLEWNQLKRNHLTIESQATFKNKLASCRCWPVEVFIPIVVDKKIELSETKSRSNMNIPKDKGGFSAAKSGFDHKINHFITFIDLSLLLYPGITSTRVVSQLFTYVENVVEDRFGSDLNMFEMPQTAGPGNIKSYKSGKTVVSKKENSKTTTPTSKRTENATVLKEQVVTEKEPAAPPVPVYNKDEEPVFIVVQVEFLNPIVRNMVHSEILQSIEAIVPPRLGTTKEEFATLYATKEFETCIKNLMYVVHDEYQIFHNNSISELSVSSPKPFLMHLHLTGAYMKMKASVSKCMLGYIKDAIGIKHELSSMKLNHQVELSDIYKKLVIKMCSIVNSKTSFDVSEYNPITSCDDLLYFALEAMEEDDFDRAQNYMFQRLENINKSDPQVWIDYAAFWMKKHDFEKAGESVKEAIHLDNKYVPALFFHGLLSWLTEDFDVAEVFLLAVVFFDPLSVEGWVTLHMFHKQMDNHVYANAELWHARMCVNKTSPQLSEDKIDPPPMTWFASLTQGQSQRVHLLTAIHLIKLSFPELAETVLSCDLLLNGQTVSYLYYLAVCHYEQGRYKDSLIHIEEALRLDWEFDLLWSLKGHNCYKLGDYCSAKVAFEFMINCTVRPESNHLVNLRLGNILMKEKVYKEAYNCYLTVCKHSPTPLSWLRLGIAAYSEDEMKEAELALVEANMLDCRMPQVWGYLALVNLKSAKPHLYNSCLFQALRFGLDDPALLESILNLCQFLEVPDI